MIFFWCGELALPLLNMESVSEEYFSLGEKILAADPNPGMGLRATWCGRREKS